MRGNDGRKAGHHAVVLALAAALLFGAAAPAASADIAAAEAAFSCNAFRDSVVAADGAGAPRATQRLKSGQPLVIVAIGSSSTEGVGASGRDQNYPAMVQRLLRRRFPGRTIVVHNRGVGGQTAGQMLARFDTDVWPLAPHLVLWQTGTIEALRKMPVDALRANLRDGIERARRRDVELVLVDPQYSADLERRLHDYPAYVETMRAVAREAAVPLVDRYVAMRRWDAAKRGPDGLLAPDRLHLNDGGYLCLATAVADFLTCGGPAACPERIAGNRDGR